MSRLQKLNLKISAAVFCVAAIGPALASRLNPVSWSLQAEQEKVAPGSTVVLRLHAQIEEGYHLYSFTTPAGGPVKTTASLQSGHDIEAFRVYQPKPDRHQDPTLNVTVETFNSGVYFLLPALFASSARAGNKVVTASIRYQACSDQICLAPVTKTATASIAVQPGVPAAHFQVPKGYQLVSDSASGATRQKNALAAPSIDFHLALLAVGFGDSAFHSARAAR